MVQDTLVTQIVIQSIIRARKITEKISPRSLILGLFHQKKEAANPAHERNPTCSHMPIHLKWGERLETKSPSVLTMFRAAREKPMEGTVLAEGHGRVLENGTKLALAVKVGDRILFGKYSGTEIKVDGQDVLIVREDEILAILG